MAKKRTKAPKPKRVEKVEETVEIPKVVNKVLEKSSRVNPVIGPTHIKVCKELLADTRQLLDQSVSITLKGFLEVEILAEALKALLDKMSDEREYDNMLFVRVPGSSGKWNGWDVASQNKKYRGWIVYNKETGEEIIRDLPREDELEFDDVVEEVKKYLASAEVFGEML